MTLATNFAKSLSDHFSTAASVLRSSGCHGEIDLFRALIDSFALQQDCYAEEIHGKKSWVEFQSLRPWRIPYGGIARCELSDIMLIWFDPKQLKIRLSFIQAKRKAARIHVANPKFQLNLEQLDLLSDRPIVSPLGWVNAPDTILRNATLESIGTFLFFYQNGTSYESYYSVATNITKNRRKIKRNSTEGLLCTGNVIRSVGKYKEQVAAETTYEFALSVYLGLVGSPIYINDPIFSWIDSYLANVNHIISRELQNVLYRIRQQNFRELTPPSDNDSLHLNLADKDIPSRCILIVKGGGDVSVHEPQPID